MQTYSGWQYLLIDVANNAPHDLDKQTFETRIKWAEDNFDNLEQIANENQWKNRPLFIKAVDAIRKTQRGEPTGHLVGFDAVCSGMQIMSILTGCIAGAKATGLINSDSRADAYTECTEIMEKHLGYHTQSGRTGVKKAVMTSLYGSKQQPKNQFGDDTPELDAFYKAMFELAPGACELLTQLLASWQPYAKEHAWKLPDGFDAVIKVTQRKEHRIEVDELGHSSFTYVYYVNEGCRWDKKNAANVIHSIDGYILRSLLRRCTYDRELIQNCISLIQMELLERTTKQDLNKPELRNCDDPSCEYYIEQYTRSGVADPVIAPYLTEKTVLNLTGKHLRSLNKIFNSMLEHPSFEVVTVHDDFRAHPNNINALRKHYRDILIELAGSELLADIFSQIYGVVGTYPKLTPDLAQQMQDSNYALC